MHPILTVVQLGPRALPIGSYGALLCVAIAVVAAGSLRAAQRARLDLGACIAALGLATAGGFAGGWLLHALVQCARLGSLRAGFAQPGLAIPGALLGGAFCLRAAGRRLGLPVLAFAALAVPWLALGQALGRIGCLLGGCCYGRPGGGPLAIHYRDPLAPAAAAGAIGRHPWPLYEAAALLLLALLLRLAFTPRDPRRVLAYAEGYAALRFLLEPLRGDAIRGVFFGGTLSSAQLIALAALLACALAHARVARMALAAR